MLLRTTYKMKPPPSERLKVGSVRGLVGCWLFNERSGLKVFDSSTRNNKGTLDEISQWKIGKFGSAVRFDGSSQYINCGDNQELNLSTQLTIAAWIKPNGADEAGYILSKYDSVSTGYAMYWRGATDVLQFWYGNGVTVADITSDAVFVDNNVWVHAVIVKDAGGKVSFYRNGVPVGSGVGVTIQAGVEDVLIGNRTGGTELSHYYNGLIDNVMLFDRAFEASEVKKCYSKPFWMFERSERVELCLAAGR